MPIDTLSDTFAALADPTRRALVARLARGEASVNELASPFDMSLPAISKHLKVLERAGLISRSRQAQSRPCTLEERIARHRPAAGFHEGQQQVECALADAQRLAALAQLARLGTQLEAPETDARR